MGIKKDEIFKGKREILGWVLFRFARFYDESNEIRNLRKKKKEEDVSIYSEPFSFYERSDAK